MLIDAPQHPLAKKARKAALLPALAAQNKASRRSILGDAPVVVSLTSYAHRLETVSLTIESISRGRARPRRFILWVDEAELDRTDRDDLRRLQTRGLEILPSANYYSYKKSYPYARDHADDGLALVVADDDILYPRGWLAGLVEAHVHHPGTFVGYRAHEVRLHDDELGPYASWTPATPQTPGPRTFITTGGGSVFPVELLRALRDAGETFLETAPRADDVWANVTALRAGVPVRLIPNELKALGLPGVQQKGSLHESNVHGGNDEQIKATYTDADLALLRAAR